MIKKINRTKPDIIIFTGDLIDKDYEISNKEIEMIKKELTLLNAELGKYYITGEEDKEKSISLLNEAGFTNLNTDVQYIYNNTKKPILLAGKDTLNNKESIIETKDFKILALHNPSYADKYKEYNFDMIVSGHTHNGQINIPKIKDLLIKGKHKKNYQKIDNTELYINPGIGTNKPNARLFNHPTIYLYRLNKASTN